MLAEFSIVPLGKGESLSSQIARVITIVEESGLPYRLNPMGTVVEGGWDEIMGLIRKCHYDVVEDSRRVVTTIKIDERPGMPDRITEKLRSVEEKLGRAVRT